MLPFLPKIWVAGIACLHKGSGLTLFSVGPVSIQEAARRVARDVKGVHGDVTALLAAGLLNRTESGAGGLMEMLEFLVSL